MRKVPLGTLPVLNKKYIPIGVNRVDIPCVLIRTVANPCWKSSCIWLEPYHHCSSSLENYVLLIWYFCSRLQEFIQLEKKREKNARISSSPKSEDPKNQPYINSSEIGEMVWIYFWFYLYWLFWEILTPHPSRLIDDIVNIY